MTMNPDQNVPINPLKGAQLLRICRKLNRQGGFRKADIVRACGYMSKNSDGSEWLNYKGFHEEYDKAIYDEVLRSVKRKESLIPVRNTNSRRLERLASEQDQIVPKDTLEIRQRAQRKLQDGKGKLLTRSELEALPAFQRDALPVSIANAARRNGDPLIGAELIAEVARLHKERVDEQRICRRCGYQNDQIGVFRGRLAKALGIRKAPLERLMLIQQRRNPPADGAIQRTHLQSMPLTGTELLVKIKELGDVSKSDLVRGCGYVSTKQDGTARLNFTAFYEALLEAKGVRNSG